MNQNPIDSLKLKRSGKIKENLFDNKYKDISNPFPAKQELDGTLQLDDLSLDKTLINNRHISSKNSSKLAGFIIVSIDNKTLKDKLRNSLARDSIISNCSCLTEITSICQTLLRVAWKRRQCCRHLLSKKTLHVC